MELPECLTAGWPHLQSDLHPSHGPSMEFALAELLPTQNCCKQENISNHENQQPGLTLVVEVEERSSCFPPSCREVEAPMIFHRVEEVEDSSNYQSSRCSRSSVLPRAAVLTGSSEVWLRRFADLYLLLLLPSCPSSLPLLELAERVYLDQNCRGTQRLLELLLCLLLCHPQTRLLEEAELHHPAQP